MRMQCCLILTLLKADKHKFWNHAVKTICRGTLVAEDLLLGNKHLVLKAWHVFDKA